MPHSEPSRSTVDDSASSAAARPPTRSPHRMSSVERWTAAGAVGTIVGVLIAALAWWFPNNGDEATPRVGSSAPPAAASPGTPSPTGAGLPPAAAAALTFLDTQSPQAGGPNLVPLPSALRGQPGYEHPIVIMCPSNANNDQVREVTYLLRGRYRTFSATVRPHFTSQEDSRTDVLVIVGIRERRDTTLTRQEKGRQFNATMTAPAPLSASVEGAEELTFQVRCEWPEGFVALTAAGVTRAS